MGELEVKLTVDCPIKGKGTPVTSCVRLSGAAEDASSKKLIANLSCPKRPVAGQTYYVLRECKYAESIVSGQRDKLLVILCSYQKAQ